MNTTPQPVESETPSQSAILAAAKHYNRCNDNTQLSANQTPDLEVLIQDAINTELASQKRELDDAISAGTEYISKTDAMLCCEFFFKNETRKPGCDCRACVLSERDSLTTKLAAAEAEIERLKLSLPLLHGPTKNEARKLLGDILRHKDSDQGSHGCVEVQNAHKVVECLVSDRDSLRSQIAAAELAIGCKDEALKPLVAIAEQWSNDGLDESRPHEWEETKGQAWTKEIYSGRGGKELLTLGDCFKAQDTMSTTPYALWDELIELRRFKEYHTRSLDVQI